MISACLVTRCRASKQKAHTCHRVPTKLASLTTSSRPRWPAVCASRWLPSSHCNAVEGHICLDWCRLLNLTWSCFALRQAVTSLCGLAEAEDWDNFVEQLLLQHYDAAYDKARRRHQQAASQQRAKHPKREDGPDAGLSVELSTSQSVSPVEMSTSQSVSPASTANTPGDSGCIVQPNMHLLSLPNMDDDIFSEAALNLLKTYDPAALQIT